MNQYLTIDIGGTYIKYGLMTEEMELRDLSKVPTPATMPEFLATLENLIKQYQSLISGLAISCPGTIDSQTGYVFQGGLIPYLKTFPLAQYLKEKSGVEVTVLNDADAAGLAEAQLGHLRDSKCGAALVLGTGVGLSMVSRGELLTWSQLQSPVFLRHSLRQVWEQKEKPFQQVGQILGLHLQGLQSLVENRGSAVQFVKQASQELGLGQEDGIEVFNRLKEGADENLMQTFQAYCQEIANLILNLFALFQLDKVVIGGGISQQAILIDTVKAEYQRLLADKALPILELDLPIEACQFHNQANLIGALCFYLKSQEKFLKP
ncbi:ROK family protein [Streptococcus pneumoniae]